MSDKELTAMSDLVDLLEEGDEVMADKGFKIQDILSKLEPSQGFHLFCTTSSRWQQQMLTRRRQ